MRLPSNAEPAPGFQNEPPRGYSSPSYSSDSGSYGTTPTGSGSQSRLTSSEGGRRSPSAMEVDTDNVPSPSHSHPSATEPGVRADDHAGDVATPSVTDDSAARRFHDVGPFPPWIRATVERSLRRTEAGATLRWGSARRPVGERVCGCRPGVPFTPPHTVCYCCHGPGVRPNTPPSPFGPAPPGRSWAHRGDPVPGRN